MPQLVAWDKRYKDDGLQVIGIHCQDGSDDEVLKVAKDLKMKFPVTKDGRSAPSLPVSGIPHMFVFDAKGDLIYDGHPRDEEAERAIKRALREAPKPGQGGRPAAASGPAPQNAELIPQRVWTNAKGRTMTAALLAVEGDTAKFKMANGSVLSYPVADLAAADQETIRAAGK